MKNSKSEHEESFVKWKYTYIIMKKYTDGDRASFFFENFFLLFVKACYSLLCMHTPHVE